MSENNTLEITVDGKVYKVVQIIKSINFFPYDNQNFAYISEKNGKMGVFSQEQELMLAEFEYDNITYAGNGVYIVIKNNKMGLIHPAYTDYDFCYNLQMEIPGEYDFIHTLGSYGKNFILQKNKLDGIAVCAYLSEPRYLTDEYDSYRYFREGFIELRRPNERILIDTYTGNVITDDPKGRVFNLYPTATGTVIQEFLENDKYRLTFICEYFGNPIFQAKTKTIDYEGGLYVTYEEVECGYPLGELFRIERPDGKTETFNNKGFKIELKT
ncbi:MAG: hypothetical protein IKB93_02650 [Clostridia bacterium]|nr:hypothetical protein [Clostridia bacterium]